MTAPYIVPMPPITTISRHVHHDFKAQRGVGPVVAQPERQHGAGQRGKQRRQHAGRGAVHHHAVADGLGAELVLADGLQHAAKGRVDDAQQRQHQHHGRDEQQVVGDQLAVDEHAQHRVSKGSKLGDQQLGHLEGQAVLAAGDVRQLRGQRLERRRHGQRDHGKEDGPHPQRKQPHRQRQHSDSSQRPPMPTASAAQVGPCAWWPWQCRRRRCQRTWCAQSSRCRCSPAAGRSWPPAR
jgi:hypothetical protein